MIILAQIAAPQLPALPEGPSLERVRGPIEASGFSAAQLILAAVAAILIIAGILWLYLRTHRKPATIIPPDATALAEIEAAAQASDDELFAITCAHAVRRFLGTRFRLPITSQTSHEATRQLPITAEHKERIQDFLLACDGVKFARQALTPAQRKGILDTARSIVAHSRKEIPPT
ncbi:MAG: hypothetical protein ACPGIC_01170 [Opitutales bacterium]